jgi:hypothetical protein
MKTSDDLVSVKGFITESERNIEIASAIYEQFPAARQDIVREFFRKLAADLERKLPGWSTRYDPPFFDHQYGAFGIFKNTWNELYEVRIEAFKGGESMIYGVWRDERLLRRGARSEKLLAEVRKNVPDATSRQWYEAEIRMTSPAKDWRKPNVLWRMHSDKTFRA